MQATNFDFASTKISFFSSLGQKAFTSFFSLFLPTCLTSLSSHIHLCDLTFVHPFINVVGLLYMIIEEKMNPILLFQTSYSSKPISLCWLLSTCPISSFNELRQSMGWNMVQCTQQTRVSLQGFGLRNLNQVEYREYTKVTQYTTPLLDKYWNLWVTFDISQNVSDDVWFTRIKFHLKHHTMSFNLRGHKYENSEIIPTQED